MNNRANAKSIVVMKCLQLLTLCAIILAPGAWAAEYSWRVESGSGDWDHPGSEDSDYHWWDGAANVNTPATGACNSVVVDNDTFPAWNQNISDFSCSRIIYGAGAGSVRTLTGNGITFLNCGSVNPAIINSSAVTHVIGALSGGLVGSENYPLDLTAAGEGGLTIQSDIDNRGPSLNITASSGATVLVESGVISGTGGVVKAGLGTLTLNGANTFSGGLIHNTSGGRINLGHAQALGSGTYTINGTASVVFDNTSGAPLTIPNNLTISGGSPSFTGTDPLTIEGTVSILGDNRTLTVSNSTLTLSGPLAGTNRLTKGGSAGTLTLTGDSASFTGGVTLATGTMNLGHLNALGSGAFIVNGGTFDNATGGAMTLPNPFVIGSGNSTFAGTHSMTLTNTITLNATRSLGILSNQLIVAVGIVESGAGGYVLSKTGAGTLVLNASNDVRGGITLGTGGATYIGHPQALGTGTFTCAQTTIENTTGGPLTLTNTFKFNGNPAFGGEFHPLTFAGDVLLNNINRNVYVSNNVLTFAGVLSGTNSLSKYASGTLALNGDNTFTKGFLLSAGTVSLGHPNALGGGLFTLGAAFVDNSNPGDLVVTNAVYMNGSPTYLGSVGNLEFGGPISVNLSRTITVSNRTLTLSGEVSSNVVLTKAGPGVLVLSGSSTGLGGVALSAGTLNIGHLNALGVTGAFSAGTAFFDNTSAGPLVLSNAFTFSGNPTFVGTQPLTFTGAVSLVGSRVLTIAAGTLTLGGRILNANLNLTKDGPGTLVLSGTNSHQSGTIVSNGTLCINSPTAVGSGRLSISGASTIDNTSGAGLALANNNQQDWGADFTFTGSDSLDMGTGNVYLNGSRTLTVAANTLTVGGTITVTNGLASGLTKEGSGRLVIGKAVTYTGDTAINAGTLVLSGAGALLTSTTLTVAAGATLDASARSNATLTLASYQVLQGGGTVFGTVTNAGTVAPGASPGTLSVVGDYSQTGAGTLAIELSGTAPGTGHDVLAVASNVVLDGTLTVTTPSFTPASGNSFTVLTASAVSGTFATTNLPAGDWTVDYQADKVVLTLDGGASAPILGVSPASLSFAATRVGEFSELTFTVTNSGTAQLDGTATVSGVAFTLPSGSPFSVAAGAVASVTVRFSPTMTAGYAEDVTFLSNGGVLTNGVSGTGYVQAGATNTSMTLVGGRPTFGFSMPSGALYRVQASTNLLDGSGWADLTEHLTNNFPGGTIPAYSETNTAAYPRRAYRISSP